MLAGVGCVDAPPPTPHEQATTTATAYAESVERRVRTFTVRVRNRTCSSLGTGSGVLLGGRTLVTNAHVVEGALELGIDTWDGREVRAVVAKVATLADLAVVELADDHAASATLRHKRMQPDERLVAAGYPGGGPLTFSPGRFVDYTVDRSLGTTEAMLRFDALVRPGNSGGPLVDQDGNLVGVVFARETGTDHGLAVPIDVLIETLEDDALEPVRSCLDP